MVKIKLCDFVFDVNIKYKYTDNLLKDYKAEAIEKADFSVTVTEEDLNEAYKKDPSYPIPYHEALCLYRKICTVLAHHDTFMLHSSVVVHDGFAYVFTAKSGTGKTTHSRLWLKNFPDSFIINGDKPLFRLIDGEFYVYGTPWCGKENYNKNTSAKVKALCFIERAEENRISTMSVRQVLSKIFEQLFIPEDKKGAENVFSLLSAFLSSIPSYNLGCTISDEAALLAEKTMNTK